MQDEFSSLAEWLESMTSVWIPLLTVMLVLTMTILLFYSALFRTVEVSTMEPPIGPMVVAYQTKVGDYKDAGPLFSNALSLLPHRLTMGIYYDDPDGVPAGERRFAVGSILAQGDTEPKASEMDLMVENGFRVIHLPKPNFAVVSSFPFKCTLSIFLAIYKVYPKLKEYIASKGLCAYPAVEVYTDDTIWFMMPLSRQEEFYVPEFSEDEESIATTEYSTHSMATRLLETTLDSPCGGRQSESSQPRGGRPGSQVPSSSGGDVEPKASDEDVFVKPMLPAEKKGKGVGKKSNANTVKKSSKSPDSTVEEPLADGKDDEVGKAEKDGEDSASDFEDLAKELLADLMASEAQQGAVAAE